MAKPKPTYVGNPKHKNMPHRGVHGSLCPASIDERRAQELLDASHPDPKDSTGQGKHYCTDGEEAFCAQCHDEVRNEWHGYPVAWPEVPPAIRATWRDSGTVKARVMRGRPGPQ